MKKIIFLVVLVIAGFFAWRYFKNPQRKATQTEKAIDATVNYVPNAINRKNQMEDKINESAKLESDKIKAAMDETK